MARANITMNRAEIEKAIEPIIQKCRKKFAPGSSETEDSPDTDEPLRPETRRVSLIASLAESVLGGDFVGRGLEVGSGYGCLLFPMASLFPKIQWSAIEHPDQPHVSRETYRSMFRSYNCHLEAVDLLREPFPFPDNHFALITFSEVLEHLPTDRVNFVLSEIARTIQPGGVLIASSPNQASLENRLRLLKGKSILDMPNEIGKGIFGHIRLYTPAEIQSAMAKRGFTLERCEMESNNSGYRGNSDRSWIRRAHRAYEYLETKLDILGSLGDTWHMAFRKTAANSTDAGLDTKGQRLLS
jgi:2-polyprenyl-3-methyl-5-hydroxy-6-metoxy-1,4-benzoquinol methylase